MFGREIIYDSDLTVAAERFGGFQALDAVLNPIMDALMREPTGFAIVEAAWGTVRYIRTKPLGSIPELIWYFCLEQNGNVVITHVEEYNR